MTVREIIEKYLKENEFDGLCGDDCGCPIDDLMPCMCDSMDSCVPGYKVPCDCGGGCDYHISESKDQKEEEEEKC